MTDRTTTPEPESTPDRDRDALDANADAPIHLDRELIEEYRWFLHGETFKEVHEDSRPDGISFGNHIRFAGHQDEGENFWFDFGRHRDGYDSGSCVLERMEQLMERGMEEQAAEQKALDEGIEMMSAFAHAWSDELIPRVVVRIVSSEALLDELTPLLAMVELRGTTEAIESLVAEHLGVDLRWSEVHWMDRCEPVSRDQTVAWRSPEESIEVLSGATEAEIGWVARLLTRESWEWAPFISLEDEDWEDTASDSEPEAPGS